VGLPQIGEVRIGKHITLTVEADDAEAASALVSQACEKLLANPIMEGFTFMIEEVELA
jgi:phosphoribosylformylglycinamidine synthase PurS subunit